MIAIARSALVLSLVAAASAARAAPPPSAAAVPLPPPPPGMVLLPTRQTRAIDVGAKAGFASPLGNGGDASATLQVEAAIPWRTTRSGVGLTLALPLRTVLPSKAERDGLEYGATALELTPTLRASVPLGGSRMSLRTEAGLGVVARWSWAQVDTHFLGRRTETDQTTTGLARIGLALDWAVRPTISIAIEPLSFGFDLDGNADWTIAAGATYRL